MKVQLRSGLWCVESGRLVRSRGNNFLPCFPHIGCLLRALQTMRLGSVLLIFLAMPYATRAHERYRVFCLGKFPAVYAFDSIYAGQGNAQPDFFSFVSGPWKRRESLLTTR